MEILNDSPEGPECVICFHKLLSGQPYSIINSGTDKGRFHVQCLEEWLQKSNNGIFTQDKINSYSIYQDDIFIEEIKIKIKINENVNTNMEFFINNNEIPHYINESTPLTLETNQNYNNRKTFCSLNKGSLLCITVAILLIIITFIVIYVLYKLL